jgi:4-hydroxy-tetrahydrodipicolinate synthase
VDGARRVNARLLPSFAFETGDDAPNPIPTKAMLRHLGLPVGQCRLPMGDAPDWVEERAVTVWDQLVVARG